MIRAAKAKVMGAPTPMAGLALGIASLGWSWENMIAAHGVAQWVGAAIASVLLIVLAFKFLWHGHLLRQDLAHPVVGSVVPTFAMATMVVSASLGHFTCGWRCLVAVCRGFTHSVFGEFFVSPRPSV